MNDTAESAEDLLAQLKDIHTPELSWWPPAPGWWLVLLLCAALIGLCCWLLMRRQRRLRWVVLAELELAALERDFAAGEIDARGLVSGLSVLMRRTAIASMGRAAVARATDEQWMRVIGLIGNGQGFSRSDAETMLAAPYRAQPLGVDEAGQLLQACKGWLRGARRPPGESRV